MALSLEMGMKPLLFTAIFLNTKTILMFLSLKEPSSSYSG